jgi:hypothetical protein
MIVTDQLENRLNSNILGHLVLKMHLFRGGGGGFNTVSIRNQRRHLPQRPSSMSEDESDEKGVGVSPFFETGPPLTIKR